MRPINPEAKKPPVPPLAPPALGHRISPAAANPPTAAPPPLGAFLRALRRPGLLVPKRHRRPGSLLALPHRLCTPAHVPSSRSPFCSLVTDRPTTPACRGPWLPVTLPIRRALLLCGTTLLHATPSARLAAPCPPAAPPRSSHSAIAACIGRACRVPHPHRDRKCLRLHVSLCLSATSPALPLFHSPVPVHP